MKYKIFAVFLSFSLLAAPAVAQEYSIDQKIKSIVDDVSTERLKKDIQKLASFHTRHALSERESEKKGIGAAQRWFYSEFQKINDATGGKMKIYYDRFTPQLRERYQKMIEGETVEMANVVAVIPGEKSERTLIINGHYDSRTKSITNNTGFAPGANDDGTGTAALLELARILGDKELDNTIILAAFTAEEIGLIGSSHMAEQAKKNDMNLEGVIANDMIGNIIGGNGNIINTQLRCFSPGPTDSPSRNFALYVNKISDEYFPPLELKMIFRLDRFGRGGDHSSFIREGFAGIRFTEPYENYRNQHSPYDTPENMNFDYFTKTTRLNAAIAYYWANSPAPPMLVSISRDEEYRTVLKFICNQPEENLRGFKIYMRKTDEGYWRESRFFPEPQTSEHRIFGQVYEVKLRDRDQDYYTFAAASVNKEGYESIATTFDYQKVREAAKKIREQNKK